MTDEIATPLSEQQIASFHAAGYLVVPSFLAGDEFDTIRRGVDQVASWPIESGKWIHHHEETPFGVRLSRSENFVQYQLDLKTSICDGKIIKAIGQLWSESAVLYKEKINYKYPGGGGFAAHQDAPAYDFVSANITANVAIDHATVENGCLWFSPGAYDSLLPMNDVGCLADSVTDELEWKPVELAPGDVVFFTSFAPHFSRVNDTDQPRRSLYLTYNKLSEGDLREKYYADRQRALADKSSSGQISKIGHFQGKTVS